MSDFYTKLDRVWNINIKSAEDTLLSAAMHLQGFPDAPEGLVQELEAVAERVNVLNDQFGAWVAQVQKEQFSSNNANNNTQ